MPNLVVNGTFERGTSEGPTSWTRELTTGQSTPPSTSGGEWKGALSVSGAAALRLSPAAGSHDAWVQRLGAIDPEVRYRFRVHVRASRVTSGSHAAEVRWLGQDGSVLGRQALAATQADTWQEVALHDLVPPAGTTEAQLVLQASQPGTYLFDDVVFTRKDESLPSRGGRLALALYDLPQVDLVVNGGMEQRLASASVVPPAAEVDVCTTPAQCDLPAFWSPRGDVGSAELRRQTIGVDAHALETRLLTEGRADWLQSIPNISPSRRYSLFARVIADNVAPGSHTVEVQWIDAAGQVLGSASVASQVVNSWQDLSLPLLQPPAGTVEARLLLRAGQAGRYLFDAVRFELALGHAERLRELKDAGFSLAPAFGLQPWPGHPSLDEVDAAGLKALYRPLNIMVSGEGERLTLSQSVQSVASHRALSVWMGVDEPAWERWTCQRFGGNAFGLCPEFVADAYRVLRDSDAAWEQAGHQVWVNHAPRGTLSKPDDFGYLRAFNAGADILSMDIYPVPRGNGHSALTDQTLSSVGAYTDILYEQVAEERERQAKPLWMVLQGFGWSDLDALAGETFTKHGHFALELHWLDEDRRPVTQVGADGVSREVVFVLPSDRPNEWRRVEEVGLIPPPQARSARVALRAYGAGTYWFDDVHLSNEVGEDLLWNGSFEQGAPEGPAGWLRYETVGPGTLDWDSSFASKGSHSVRIELEGPHKQVEWWQEVPVDPTARYQLSGKLYAKLRPTWVETRYMAYTALIHGARGVVWWGTSFIPHNSELWTDLLRIARELSQLSPALSAPAPFRQASAAPHIEGRAPIEVALAQDVNGVLLIAANPSPLAGEHTLHIDGLPLTKAERLFEPGALALSNNGFDDHFEPYEVHVYRLR